MNRHDLHLFQSADRNIRRELSVDLKTLYERWVEGKCEDSLKVLKRMEQRMETIRKALETENT